MELFIELGVILLFLILGVVFSMGKCAFLIAGYNTAPKAEKAKYDEKALCCFMGRLMFALAGCQCVMALGLFLVGEWFFGVGIAAYLCITFGAVIYANTGNRFRKKQE